MCFLLVKLVCVLVSMAYLTLLERKYLGYLQLRKGPNKVSLMGLLQPIADALKLMSKNKQSPYLSWFVVFYISPILMLFLAMVCWGVIGFSKGVLLLGYNMILVVVVLSVGVYSLLASGWVSNSKYAFLGAYRAIAQTISYEVAFIFIFITPLILVSVYTSAGMFVGGMSLMTGLIMLPVMGMWYITCLAETNRAPFDFAEGESELVSGFNIEYSSFEFAMLFMAEYTSILFMCMLSCILFCTVNYLIGLVYMFGVSVFIFARGSYPRLRYDQLMMMVWKSFLSTIMVGMMVVVLLFF